MLNLFIAIIVNTMQTMHDADHRQERERIDATARAAGGAARAQNAACGAAVVTARPVVPAFAGRAC